MKILKLYRVFGTMKGEDLTVPAIEVAADNVGEALVLADRTEWRGHPVTGLREVGEVVVP